MRAETVIATHGNTDFDAFAALLAARRLYPDAVACLTGSLNRNVREFYRLHADELNLVDASRLELTAIRRLIVVETTHAARLGDLEAVARDPDVEKVVFDHHAGEAPDWASVEHTVVSEDGALTTTLVGVLAEREIAVTPLEATVFALGIHEDTGSLTYPTATQRDAEALAWCLRHGASQELLADFLHTPLTEEERELLAAILEQLEPRKLAGVELLVGAVSWPRYVDGVSNLAHKVVDLTDCKALVLLVELEERVFCVARSRTPAVDAVEIAGLLGGGGHAQAASAIFKEGLEEARRRLDDGLDQAVRAPLTAAQLMSKPARSVEPDATVARALVACQRHTQSGILVAEGDRLVGVVGREDLDRAVAHGLSHAPVKGIMSTQVATCDESTPLAELQRLLAAGDERVAVLEGERIAGVVTRSDLLRALGGAVVAAERGGPQLTEELARLERLQPVFEAV